MLSSMQEMCSNKDRCLDNVCEQWLVGLALNFIIGDKVTPLNAKKHMETPLMGSIDRAYILVMLTGKRQCTSIGDSIRHISVVYSCVCVCVSDRSVHPYCAPSLQAFLDWNVGKRRAAEVVSADVCS